MHIITLSCPSCNTIVAANELEKNRVMKCPALNCETVLRFTDLSKSDQEHFLEHYEQYQI